MFIPQIEHYLSPPVLAMSAVVVLTLMVGLILFGRGWGRLGGFALFVLALVWVPVNKPLEGPILMRLGHDKGLVLADVFAVVVLIVATWRIAANRSERREASELSVYERT